jgi:hypothetical protein
MKIIVAVCHLEQVALCSFPAHAGKVFLKQNRVENIVSYNRQNILFITLRYLLKREISGLPVF